VAAILRVDLVGVALVLEEFGRVIARGGSGVVISSMARHMIPALEPEQDAALARTPADELMQRPVLQDVHNSGAAYTISKQPRRCAYGPPPSSRATGVLGSTRSARHHLYGRWTS
jgi:hypothetical protein